MSGFHSLLKNSVMFDIEPNLQIIQHDFYTKVQNLFSSVGSLVLPNNMCELFAITNGLTIEKHMFLYKTLTELVPYDIEMLIGFDQDPFLANENASLSKQRNQFTQYEGIFGRTSNEHMESVSLINLNFKNNTSNSKKSQYEQSLDIQKIYFKMSQFFVQRNALTFYMGGNNFMVLDSKHIRRNTKDFVKYANDVLGISVNCGIGIAKNARLASLLTTASLDFIDKYSGNDKTSKIKQMKSLDILDQSHLY